MATKEQPKYMQRLEEAVDTLNLTAAERAKVTKGIDREQAELLIEAIESYSTPKPKPYQLGQGYQSKDQYR